MGIGEERSGPSRLSFAVDSSPEAVRVVLRGEADLGTSSILRDALQEAASLHPAVEVDLRQLEFIDTSCVRRLLEAHGHVVSRGGTMRVLIGGGTVRRVFEILRLDEQLSVRRAGTLPAGDDNTPRSSWNP
jgi:anti-sigma B factor antagonist